jgi:hypothetical protein
MNIPRLTEPARKYVIALVLIVLLLAIGGFAAYLSSTPEKTYRNDTYHFSVRIPKTYAISESSPKSGSNYTVDFLHAADTVQLTLSSWQDSSSVLTKESAMDQFHNPNLEGAQIFTIAPGVVGLAMFNNRKDPDAISDIWFAYKNNLYQFSSFESGVEDLLPVVRTIELY